MNTQQLHNGTMLAIADQRLKIQVATDKSRIPLWADLQGTPEFTSVKDANQYITEHDGEQLQRDGLLFRVMPLEYPCKYGAFLEKMVQP